MDFDRFARFALFGAALMLFGIGMYDSGESHGRRSAIAASRKLEQRCEEIAASKCVLECTPSDGGGTWCEPKMVDARVRAGHMSCPNDAGPCVVTP